MRDRDEPRLFKVGRTWHTWVYVGGRRVKRTTRCRSKAAARRAARQFEEDATDPARAAAQATTVEDALDAILLLRREQAKAGERSADTAEFYKKKSGHLLRLLGRETSLALFCDSRPLDEYVSVRRREIESPTGDHTIYKELVVMRAALKHAKRRGLWRGEIDAVVPALSPRYKPRKRWLTPEQLDQVLAEMEADDAARAAFCVATGAETRATKLAQREDLGEQVVHLRGTKRASRTRDVPVITDWQKSLLKYATEHARGVSGLLFKKSGDEFRWALRYAARRAGVDHCTPNDLRRTFGTWLRAAGARTENIAPALGHADSRTLERVYDGTTVEQLAELLKADMGLDRVGTDASQQDAKGETGETGNHGERVPRGGIEPPTRGFSVHGRIWRKPRQIAALPAHLRRAGTRFGQRGAGSR